MTTTDPKSIALQFNSYINDRDIDGLAQLMTDDHTFIDTVDSTVHGKQSCLAGWREFFRLFPDYKNIFETVKAKGTFVIMIGHSTCADQRLEGPALWTAKIRDEKVAAWRVYEDTADNRQRLRINDE